MERCRHVAYLKPFVLYSFTYLSYCFHCKDLWCSIYLAELPKIIDGDSSKMIPITMWLSKFHHMLKLCVIQSPFIWLQTNKHAFALSYL